MHPKDGGHHGHIVIAPDTAVIVNDLRRDTNDPKGHVDTSLLVVTVNKTDLPALRDLLWALVSGLIEAS